MFLHAPKLAAFGRVARKMAVVAVATLVTVGAANAQQRPRSQADSRDPEARGTTRQTVAPGGEGSTRNTVAPRGEGSSRDTVAPRGEGSSRNTVAPRGEGSSRTRVSPGGEGSSRPVQGSAPEAVTPQPETPPAPAPGAR